MRIEVGKYYRNGYGDKVYIGSRDDDPLWPFDGDNGESYRENGSWHPDEKSDQNDLIQEWNDSPQPEVEQDGFITVHSTRAQILDTAKQYVTADRQTTHGKPEDTFSLIASYWSLHLGHTVTAHDVGAMMALLKLARSKAAPGNMDNWVDLAGYAACAAELVGK